ncbi:hypothetical protein HanRHA438_Chr14g0662571 [Helianthus annuus]|nr:hypothetical protein HanRHA438_Chr14g0662571 [Helianthus annuus]
MSRVTNRMFLFCFYIFSMSHGRAPIARPCTLSNYWWWSTILHDVIRSLTRFDIARPFFIWHGRSLPGSCCTPGRTGRSVPRLAGSSDLHGVQDLERPCIPGLAFNALHAELHPRSLPGLS